MAECLLLPATISFPFKAWILFAVDFLTFLPWYCSTNVLLKQKLLLEEGVVMPASFSHQTNEVYLCNHYFSTLLTFLDVKNLSDATFLDMDCWIHLTSLKFVRRVWLCSFSSSPLIQLFFMDSSWGNAGAPWQVGFYSNWEAAVSSVTLVFLLKQVSLGCWSVLLKYIICYLETQASFWL